MSLNWKVKMYLQNEIISTCPASCQKKTHYGLQTITRSRVYAEFNTVWKKEKKNNGLNCCPFSMSENWRKKRAYERTQRQWNARTHTQYYDVFLLLLFPCVLKLNAFYLKVCAFKSSWMMVSVRTQIMQVLIRKCFNLSYS